MCAMDRSGDDGLSQSGRDVISCIKSIYHNSPVSVCVRNERHETLYSNDSFQQLFSFFKAESEKNYSKQVLLVSNMFSHSSNLTVFH
ncbi:hypothetical protein KAM260_54650 (plasmid) [Klebsiella pneumoniae]|nr:hypothetical protein KAM260_54650 [Klebsiella pneumoniae]